MRHMTILAILIISIFLIGCAEKEIAVADDTTTTTATKTTSSGTKTTTTTKTTTAPTSEAAEDETREAVVVTDTTGDTTTFEKLPDYTRQKSTTEICNLESPLECTKYQAQDGIVYITVKNQGYTSKINDVTLYMGGESCDPSGSYIETGQIKEFECYVDPYTKFVSGDLAVKYYSPMEDKSFTKTGKIAVKME